MRDIKICDQCEHSFYDCILPQLDNKHPNLYSFVPNWNEETNPNRCVFKLKQGTLE